MPALCGEGTNMNSEVSKPPRLSPVKHARDQFPKWSANRFFVKLYGVMHVIDKGDIGEKAAANEVADYLSHRADGLAAQATSIDLLRRKGFGSEDDLKKSRRLFARAAECQAVAASMCEDSQKKLNLFGLFVTNYQLAQSAVPDGTDKKIANLMKLLRQHANAGESIVGHDKKGAAGNFDSASRMASKLSVIFPGTNFAASFRELALELGVRANELLESPVQE